MESSASSDCEVRAAVKFLNAEGVTGSEVHCGLSNVCMHRIHGLERDLGSRYFAMEKDLQSVVA